MDRVVFFGNLAEIFALLSAALFFGYKVFTGYFRINLSVAVVCHRQKLDGTNMDVLVITALLERGAEGSLRLHNAQVKITTSGRADCFDFPGIRRSAYSDETENNDDFGPGGGVRINWEENHSESPYICMTPKEKTELALFCEVTSGEVCRDEVAIAGRKVLSRYNILRRALPSPRMAQWKASAISLPIVDR